MIDIFSYSWNFWETGSDLDWVGFVFVGKKKKAGL
jgi:hypothetical protein